MLSHKLRPPQFGCTSGPLQPKGAWPWEYGGDYGKQQTGDYLAISGNVGHFGEVPKAIQPIAPESLKVQVPEVNSASETSVSQTPSYLLPTSSKLNLNRITSKAKSEYDFTVSDIKLESPSYLPTNSVHRGHDITAFNHGGSPVSITIAIDQNSSQNILTTESLPLNSVLPPNTDKAVVHSRPKVRNEIYNLRYMYSWSIGDYTATHRCPEHYRFPFKDNIRAFANVSDNVNATPYNRYAVIFSMPAGTPVLAARKGRVIQIKGNDRIDILHDDSTIATYRHLGTITESVIAGKVVSTEDVIGIVGATGNQNEAYMQLTVWRPEPRPLGSLTTNSPTIGFNFVSFPLEFCRTGSTDCRVLTQDQAVSRNKITALRKQGKHKVKQ